MDELPADAASVGLSGVVAGDAVAGRLEAAEPFDVDVDHVAGLVALVAAHGFGRFQVADAAEPGAAQDPADGGRRRRGLAGDLLAGEALSAQGHDPLLYLRRGRSPQSERTRGAIRQARRAFGPEPVDPFADGLGIDLEGRRHRLARLALNQHPPHQLGSTMRRQPGILVHVHSVLLRGRV